MSENGWVALQSVEDFRRYKRRPDGVIVIRGGASTKVHHPDCPHVREDAFRTRMAHHGHGYYWAPSVAAARARWAATKVCRHPSDPLAGGSGGTEAQTRVLARTEPRASTEWTAHGPVSGLRAVRGEADWALPFEPRSDAQRSFRRELRERLARLARRDDEVLHATFFGTPPPGADVENLLLYNVDDSGRAFAHAPAGLRFELAQRALPQATRPVGYLYRPVARRGTFALWAAGTTVAEWRDVPLPDPTERARVWHAFRLTRARHAAEHAGPFVVSVTLRWPGEHRPGRAARLIKPLFDGIVAALQAHGDSTTIDALGSRIAQSLGRPADEVAALLADTAGAALGIVPRLAHLRGDGFQLSPADDRCVAGELLIQPGGTTASASCRVAAAVQRHAGSRP